MLSSLENLENKQEVSADKIKLDIEQIRGILPHRYPFLLVDRILELEMGKRAVGLKNVTINEEFFEGHFPGQAVMPGVIIIESMAQVGGIVLITVSGNEGRKAYFATIDKCRFRKMVLPGDTVITEAELIKIRGNMGKVKCTASVEGKVVCEGEFMFALAEKEDKADSAVDNPAK